MRGQENIYILLLCAHFKLLFYSAASPRLVTCISPPSIAKPVLLIFDHMLVGHFLPDHSTYITNAGSIQCIVAWKKKKERKKKKGSTLTPNYKLAPLILSPIVLSVMLMASVKA